MRTAITVAGAVLCCLLAGPAVAAPIAPEPPVLLVAHTRPRCEKQVTVWAEREGIPTELPLYTMTHKYRGKSVTFHKPLFPGYVFVRFPVELALEIRKCRHVAQVLVPGNPAEFAQQLGDILIAVAAGMELRPVPDVVAGVRVTIVDGPLRGMEGWVEKRDGPFEVILRLDFIGQAAAVRMAAQSVERIGS